MIAVEMRDEHRAAASAAARPPPRAGGDATPTVDEQCRVVGADERRRPGPIRNGDRTSGAEQGDLHADDSLPLVLGERPRQATGEECSRSGQGQRNTVTNEQDRRQQVVDATAATEASMRTQTVPVNMFETTEALVVVAPLPAVTADDVTIELTGATLRFWAHLRSAAPRNYLVHEWDYGGYERVVELPAGLR